MARFVLLRHEYPNGSDRADHWDLLLEQENAARTWELLSEPHVGQTLAARPLPDHRLLYLDYEGPISGGRGHVRQFDVGTARIAQEGPSEITLQLSGAILSGSLTLRINDN